jgi:hypothetical protein
MSLEKSSFPKLVIMHVHFCCFEKNANESWDFKGNALEIQVSIKMDLPGQLT